MGKGFVMVENLFRGHPPGEHPWHRNPFFIRKPFTPPEPISPVHAVGFDFRRRRQYPGSRLACLIAMIRM